MIDAKSFLNSLQAPSSQSITLSSADACRFINVQLISNSLDGAQNRQIFGLFNPPQRNITHFSSPARFRCRQFNRACLSSSVKLRARKKVFNIIFICYLFLSIDRNRTWQSRSKKWSVLLTFNELYESSNSTLDWCSWRCRIKKVKMKKIFHASAVKEREVWTLCKLLWEFSASLLSHFATHLLSCGQRRTKGDDSIVKLKKSDFKLPSIIRKRA